MIAVVFCLIGSDWFFRLTLVLILWLVVALSALAGEIKPFATDGCSAFPDGTPWQQQLWLDCCTAHDRSYWQGGNYQQRLDADLALAQCVEGVGEPAVAQLMLAGVRVGGTPYLPTRFRWGYGWPYFSGYWIRGYKALSESELEQAKK